MKPPPRVMKALPLRAMYTAAALAKSIGISRPRMLRLLRMQGVFTYTIGRSTFVPLTEIQEKLEPVWSSIRATERSRAATAATARDSG